MVVLCKGRSTCTHPAARKSQMQSRPSSIAAILARTSPVIAGTGLDMGSTGNSGHRQRAVKNGVKTAETVELHGKASRSETTQAHRVSKCKPWAIPCKQGSRLHTATARVIVESPPLVGVRVCVVYV